MIQPAQKRAGRLSEYGFAAALAAIAVVISPVGIEFATGRPDLSFRVNAVSWTFDAFLVAAVATLLLRGRLRRAGFYVISFIFPFVLLAGAEIAAIEVHLADRIAPLTDRLLVTPKGPWPGYLSSEGHYYQVGNLRLYRPWHGDGITLNKLGLRTALPTPKKPGEWHIAVTGGSAAWGWRVRDADTIPVQLQNILRHGGHPNVSVYNFGIEGATLKAELALLERFRETYSIDQVLFFTGGNNAFDAYFSRVRNRSGPWNSELATFELVKALLRFQAVHSEPSPQMLHWLDTEVLAAALKNNTLRRELVAAADYCRRTALHCDFVLQPMLLQPKVMSGTDAAIARAFRHLYPRFGELTERLYQEALAGGPPGHVFDLTAIFDKAAQPVFQDLIHLNEAGNHIAAAQIAPIVAARLP